MKQQPCLQLTSWLLGYVGQDGKVRGAGAYYLRVPVLPFLHQHCQLLGALSKEGFEAI